MSNLFLKVSDWDTMDCASRQSFLLIILTLKKFFISALNQFLLWSTLITSCFIQSKWEKTIIFLFAIALNVFEDYYQKRETILSSLG